VLEEEADQAGGDRADDEQPGQPGVGVVRGDLSVSQAASEPAQDP
jgi:hypothetical protein